MPSIYCFVFYDTTQTFLLAQGHFLAPLVVNIFGFFCHFYFIGILGAAWSKNLTDCGRCLGLYVYLAMNHRKMESWIEWTIQCFKGWSYHMKFYKNIGLSTYIQAMFLFFFAAFGYKLPKHELICHICFINIVQIVFIVNIGLKEGLIIKLAYVVKKKKLRYTQSLGSRSLKIFFAVSLLIVFFMLMYVREICGFFIMAELSQKMFMDKYWILFVSIIIDSMNISLLTLIKAFNRDYFLLSNSSLS